MAGLIEESSVILWEINQTISFSRISRGKYLKEIMSIPCYAGSLAKRKNKKKVKGVTERPVHTQLFGICLLEPYLGLKCYTTLRKKISAIKTFY